MKKVEKVKMAKNCAFVVLLAAFVAGALLVGPAGSVKAFAAGDLKKLTVQSLWFPQGQFAGLYVAQAKGFYKDEGLDVEILPGGTDVTSEEQVENDVAQIGIAFYSSVLTYQEGGYDLVNVFQTFRKSPQWLIAKTKTGIKTGADLKGKKVGSWFGGRQFELYALAHKYRMDIEQDIKWVQQDYTMDQFYTDQIDVASAMSYNEYLLVLGNGYSEKDFNVLDMNDEGVAMLEDCLFVKKSWAKANGELLSKFLRATIKGWQFAIENPDEAGRIVFEAGKSATLEHQVAMTKAVSKFVLPDGADKNTIGDLERDKLQQTIDLGFQSGLTKKKIEIADSVDDSYWKEAVKGLK
ncbi:MAG: ABC transporter substrate-binding protein [Synergistaceae bacterium]|nr:ABC transporter substrate-binding protein [Synergistaceae bacterium]